MSRAAITLLVLLCGCATAPARPAEVPAADARGADSEALVSFRPFWRKFREAARNNDPHALAGLARFPFQLKGPTDADGTREVERAEFIDRIPSWLAADPGLQTSPTTMHAFIDEHREPVETDLSGESQARVGNFVFERGAEGWRFTLAYTD